MIIGICYKARVGKDTFGGFLKECFEDRHDRYFETTAFAFMLKCMCMEHFDLTYEQLYGDRKEEQDKRYPKRLTGFSNWTSREIMQEIGSFYRKIDYNYWVRKLDAHIKDSGFEDVIITDVRYKNEAEYVKNNGGVLIHIKRSSVDKIHGMTHESETSLDDLPSDYFHIEIQNDGTLEDLYDIAEDTSDAIIIMENMIKRGIQNG
jgi:hypothetical protein